MEPSTSAAAQQSKTQPTIMPKRKRHVLTLEKKLQIIEHLKDGTSHRILANAYNVGKSTIKDISRNKNRILEYAANNTSTLRRKSMKQSSFKEMDRLLIRWFQEQRAQGNPVTGPMLAVKAQFIHEVLKIEEPFSGSSGWITRFKARYGIRDIENTGNLDFDTDNENKFRQEFQKIIEQHQFTPDQIYNVEKAGVIWKCLSANGYGEITPDDITLSKERLTMLCCANASGKHKLPLAVVGRTAGPRSFRHLDLNKLPAVYLYLRGGCMNPKTFSTWFHSHFVPSVRIDLRAKNLSQKAVLLVTKTNTIPDEMKLVSDNGSIFVKFIPAGIANSIQPMSQGIIDYIKQAYRQEAVASGRWGDYEMKDAMISLTHHWNSIAQATLVHSWQKLLAKDPDYTAIIKEIKQQDAIRRQRKPIVRPEFHSVDNIPSNQEHQDTPEEQQNPIMIDVATEKDDEIVLDDSDLLEDIVELVEPLTVEAGQQTDDVFIQEQANNTENPSNSMSYRDALDAADLLIKYLEQQNDTTFLDLLTVKQIRLNIKNKYLESIMPQL